MRTERELKPLGVGPPSRLVYNRRMHTYIVHLHPRHNLETSGNGMTVHAPQLTVYFKHAPSRPTVWGPVLALADDLIEILRKVRRKDAAELVRALRGLPEPDLDVVLIERRD
jgi:hypothetical protein